MSTHRTRHRADPRPAPARRSRPLAIPAALAVAALGVTFAIAPLHPPVAISPADAAPASADIGSQTITVSADVDDTVVSRDGYTAATGPATLIASGTNYDWARLVMYYAGWPASDGNITVFTRWMRQENGADNWWNRNNPLNNGWGSGGGSGLGSYDSLDTAAFNAADALHRNSGYSAIAAAFAASAPTAQIEAAIWASPWASSHYANGGHWHYTPVDVVKAPDDAWG
jgi:hypothetical protein